MNQEPASSKYLASVPLSEMPLPAPPTAPAAPRASGAQRLLRTTKIATVFVTTAVITCGGALLWLNRAGLSDTAKSARRRTSNPIDFMLWFGGSDKTFEDALNEATEQSRIDWEAMREESPLYNGDFDNLDWNQQPITTPGSEFGGDL
jgi:hypothetical protein